MAFGSKDHHAASRVQASSAVTALVGPETLARLRGEAFRRYDCCRCARPGQTEAEPATVIVERYRLGHAVSVRLAHARCADSQIVEAGAAAGCRGVRRDAGQARGAGVRARPAVPAGPGPGAEGRAVGADGGRRAGEPVDVGPARAGFTLVRTGGELPGRADGWLLQLAPDAARLLAPMTR